MKKSAFNKLFALSIMLTLAACKGQHQNGKSTNIEEMNSDSTATKSTEQINEKSSDIEHSADGAAEKKSALEIPESGNENPASRHKAPNQEEVDSTKAVKTNKKRKDPE